MSITTSDLSVGVHWVNAKNGPMRGFKRFTDCEVKRSWIDYLLGEKQTYDVCFSKVSIEPGSEIVRPRTMDHHGVTEPSDNLRTNKITIGDIVTPGGQKCSRAVSPFDDKTVFFPSTSHTLDPGLSLNKDIDSEKGPGIHFFPSIHALQQSLPLSYELSDVHFNVMYWNTRTQK
jgi:hypothetical protein